MTDEVLYIGKHDFGQANVRLTHGSRSKRETVQNTVAALAGHIVRQIYCVPYVPDDLLTAIVVHDVYKARLAAHIMDDQNICTPNIPDDPYGRVSGQVLAGAGDVPGTATGI